MKMKNEISIEEVVNEWQEDSKIDEMNINLEICKTPSLHSKYVNFYVYFKNLLSSYETSFYRLGNIKRKYYRGECTADELKKYGWSQFMGLKPSIGEMNAHLEYDLDLIKVKEKINEFKTSVSSVEYILKAITYRDSSLKTLVDYNRFIAGG